MPRNGSLDGKSPGREAGSIPGSSTEKDAGNKLWPAFFFQWYGVKEWSEGPDDVVRAHLPAEWTDGKRWLTRRLNRKELRGQRFGRTWQMTDSDIAFMLGKFANFTEDQDAVEAQPPSGATSVTGMSSHA
jgi:hypothetical protein